MHVVYVRECVPPRAAWGRVEKLMEILSGVRKTEKWEMRLCTHTHTHTHTHSPEGRSYLPSPGRISGLGKQDWMKQKTIRAAEDVGKLELLGAAGGNVKWCHLDRKQFGVPQKIKSRKSDGE